MIIGIAGRVAAGKETLTSFLRERGFIYLETSKMITEELIKLGLEPSRWNQQNLADGWRKQYGVGALMKMLLEKTEPGKNYIFDSLRNAGEAEFLRKNIPGFILIGVDADQKVRFERVLKRNKASDPKVWEEFLKVDSRDFFDEKDPMGQQVGKLLEVADFKIDNSDLNRSMKAVAEIWEKIKNK